MIIFNQPLSQGMANADVYSLQIVLKVTPATGYFGPITKAAVIKFQQQNGLDAIGAVGPLTRAKLNALNQQPTTEADKPAITSVSPLNLSAGSTITISGLNLGAAGNIIKLGTRVITDITKATVGSVAFKAPIDIASGQYSITVTNPAGSVSNPVRVVILNGGSVANLNGPVISKLTPSRGGYGTMVTITGSGFKPTNNTLFVGYDKLTGISSADGKTLTFSIPSDIPHLRFSREDLLDVPGASLPFWIYVQNSDGDSNAELFTFTFYTN